MKPKYGQRYIPYWGRLVHRAGRLTNSLCGQAEIYAKEGPIPKDAKECYRCRVIAERSGKLYVKPTITRHDSFYSICGEPAAILLKWNLGL